MNRIPLQFKCHVMSEKPLKRERENRLFLYSTITVIGVFKTHGLKLKRNIRIDLSLKQQQQTRFDSKPSLYRHKLP